MGEAEASKHKDAYSGRKSESTRNPHGAKIQATSKRMKQLDKLPYEERILEQWRGASGYPVSDEAKVQFQIQALELTHRLADVRLWSEHHDPKSSMKVKDTGMIFLEFFFDGSPDEYQDQDDFTKAFEKMIESQLQERRVTEFRQKFAARRRNGAGARHRGAGGDNGDCCEGGSSESFGEDEREWKEFLRKPVPVTNLKVRSLREAGCMLSFLVCQTSISVGAAEVLGQISFQEHFPIDGKPQEESKSDKPMPRWTYVMMACTALMTVVTLFAWWQVIKESVFSKPPPVLPP